MLVNIRCFPDEVIFNRHLADVRVLSGARRDFRDHPTKRNRGPDKI